jgi:hypothetical protein
MITALTIRKKYPTKLDVAYKYYSILAVLNDFKLTNLETKILAFAAVKGNISVGGAINTFCTLNKVTSGSVTNCISRLYNNKFLVKEQDKTKINPELYIDFTNTNLLIQLHLDGKEY